jgi:hypothetical protein
VQLPVSSTVETKDTMLLTEYSKHYESICGHFTDVVTDTSDDLFFLNGKLILNKYLHSN